MKYIRYILIIFVLILASCGKQEAGIDDVGYHSGSDWQSFQVTSAKPGAVIQETEEGCVFLKGQFVYIYEKQSGSIMPLCSKSNCLHDKEYDALKRAECNACVNDCLDSTGKQLFLYQDNVYVQYTISDPDSESMTKTAAKLLRISLDGSAKDEIFRTENIELSLIHRGFLFYVAATYTADDEGKIKYSWSLYRLELQRKNPKAVVLLKESDLGEGRTVLLPLKAYGNNVYFTLIHDKTEGTDILERRILRYTYDTYTDKSDLREVDHVNYTVFNGSLVFTETDFGTDDQNEVPVFTADLSEENRKAVNMPGITSTSHFYTDSKYLYLYDASLDISGSDKERIIQVYDKEFKKIDEITVPKNENDPLYPPIGGPDYQYQLFEEDNGAWGLAIWDKSDIGTLQGKPYDQEKVYYQSSEDSSVDIDPYELEAIVTVNEPETEYICPLSEWTEEISEKAEDSSHPEFTSQYAYGKISYTDNLITCTSGCSLSTEYNEMNTIVIGYYVSGEDVYLIRQKGRKQKGKEFIMNVDLPEGGEYFIGAEGVYQVQFSFDEEDPSQTVGWGDGGPGHTFVGRISRNQIK